VVLLSGLLVPAAARAANNDFALWKLGPPDPLSVNNTPIAKDPFAQERFARFTSDLALAIAPLPAQSAATLGQAGFEVSLALDVAYMHGHQKFTDGKMRLVWPTVGTPPNQLYMTTLHVRKGLPLSLELDADVTYLGGTSLVAPSAMLKWTLLEGIRWVPEVSTRAFVTVLLGAPSMTLVVGGWDLGASYRIPIIGSSEAALYLGYQHLGMDATTANIDFDPKHEEVSNPNTDDDVFNSLDYGNPFVPKTGFHRFYFGGQVRWKILVVGADFAYGWGSNLISSAATETATYALDQWKIGFRIGLMF
jgi:hypothetical protein